METGSIIFDLRKSKKLSQRQLSEIIGVSEDTIDKWHGHRESNFCYFHDSRNNDFLYV